MRRKDREITDIDKIETIIASARYMHLGMFDGEFPYIVPLHYGYQMEKGKLTFYVCIVRKKDTSWSASKKTGMYLQKLIEVNLLLQRIYLANMEQSMRALCVEVKQ